MSKQTQNRIQEIFSSINFDFSNLYNIADNKTKNKINTYIEEWEDKGLLKGDFGELAHNIMRRTRVKNSEILELLIYSAYIEEQNKLDDIELKTFKEVSNYYYQKGQEEVNKTLKKRKIVSVIPDAIFLALLDTPNAKGYQWETYIEAIIKYNANQIYRQATIDLQQNKELDITNDIYQNIIKRQQNSKLNINDEKISGDVDLTLIGINNQAKLEGIHYFDDKAEIEFVSVEDEKTTKMCNSLDGQRFKIHDWNEFERYSESNGRITKYKCYGLVIGLNCPPIDDHFHWCRSTIMYLPVEKKIEETDDENFIEYLDINNFVKKDITKQKDSLINSAFKNNTIRNIALNNDIKNVYIYGQKSKHKANNIYLNAQWKYKEQSKKDRTIRHEVGHAIDYKHNYISTNGQLSTALEIDKQNLLKNKNKIINLLNTKKYKEYAELSDIISGLTNNQIRGKYYHSSKYWKHKHALEKETFANLFSIAGSDDIDYLNAINSLLPNTLTAFDGLIRRIK